MTYPLDTRQTQKAKLRLNDVWRLFDEKCDYFRIGPKDDAEDIEDLKKQLEEFEK